MMSGFILVFQSDANNLSAAGQNNAPPSNITGQSAHGVAVAANNAASAPNNGSAPAPGTGPEHMALRLLFTLLTLLPSRFKF